MFHAGFPKTRIPSYAHSSLRRSDVRGRPPRIQIRSSIQNHFTYVSPPHVALEQLPAAVSQPFRLISTVGERSTRGRVVAAPLPLKIVLPEGCLLTLLGGVPPH